MKKREKEKEKEKEREGKRNRFEKEQTCKEQTLKQFLLVLLCMLCCYLVITKMKPHLFRKLNTQEL
jgi:hypothetical protein